MSDEWDRAGTALRKANPAEFERFRALLAAYVAIDAPSLEQRELLMARLADFEGKRARA